MEWLKTLLEGKGISLDEDTMTEIKKELPKHFMPKREYSPKLDSAIKIQYKHGVREAALFLSKVPYFWLMFLNAATLIISAIIEIIKEITCIIIMIEL